MGKNISYNVKYERVRVQGECILQSATPIRRNIPLFVLFIMCSILLVGVPILLCYWYERLPKLLYFSECFISDASYIYIINHDNQPSYSKLTRQRLYTCENSEQQAYCFTNRYIKYTLVEDTIRALQFPYQQYLCSFNNKGLKQSSIFHLRQAYGLGTMILHRDNVLMLFMKEIMRPLYLFILFSCFLWFFQNYQYYASIVLVTATIGIAINLYQTYRLNQRIYQMAYYEADVNVLRDGKVIGISSMYVVPGDIVLLEEGSTMKMPFDGVLLEGEVLINESALTGQCTPVIKKAYWQQQHHKNCWLYEGTTLEQVNTNKPSKHFEKYRKKYGIPMVVTHTNFSTLKGQLIRIIAFPTEKQNIFSKQSGKFLVFLFVLALISYSILIIKLHNDIDGEDLALKLLDLITITVPPGLPVSMTFGIIFAMEKLRKKNIFCISPNKIITGGMVNMICFDKTGTITQSHMDVFKLIPSVKGKLYPPTINPKIQYQAAQAPTQPLIMMYNNIGINHSLMHIHHTGENVGEMMEMKLFSFAKLEFCHDFDDLPEVCFAFTSPFGLQGQAHRRFDFDSQLFRMSTIGKSSSTGDAMYLYSKGSPQSMLGIIDSSSVPSDYHSILSEYASLGFRVLAVGSRKLSAHQLQLPRQKVQSMLHFDGFQIFQNRLKYQSVESIEQLLAGQIPTIMITGDSPLTASHISYQCKISHPHKPTYILQHHNKLEMEQFHYWHHKHTNKQQLQQVLEIEMMNFDQRRTMLKQVLIEGDGDSELGKMLDRVEQNYGQVCLTGAALNAIFDDGEVITVEQIRLMRLAKIYARMKPNDKVKVIRLYQKLGKVVGMCGDGANDCGALKQADIGLSLSDGQTSISSAFTSKHNTIISMVELIKECRAALSTNYSLFNIMALYSLIQYTTVIVCQFYYSYPSDFQFLYWDLFCNFFFFLTFAYTGTHPLLSKQAPKASLFTVSNTAQVFLIFGLQLMGQILMMVGLAQIFAADIDYYNVGSESVNFERYQADGDLAVDTPETSILFLFTTLMYVATLLAFSISRPWRKEFFTNIPFMIVLVFSLTYSIVMILVPGARLALFDIKYLDYAPLNSYIAGVGLGLGAVIYLIQKCLMQPLFNALQYRYPHKHWI